ncbi:hypothetical protein [uncultured Methanobrevibacter sp.]|uniref:hypothetical protein n=1 Tax=uncultured Methanobrevibacter sp. TaxID=253161 RepID=UPI0025E67A53|nr:hypothetical protein [uncultured Methanobrevibacter sp.]
MLNKKLFFVTIFVFFIAVTVVSAADNTTDIVDMEETVDESVIIENDELNNYNPSIESNNNMSDTLNDKYKNILNSVNDEDVLSETLQYSVSNFGVSPSSFNYGSSASVSFTLVPANKNPYSYDLRLEIINSNGATKITKEYKGDTYNTPAALYYRASFSYPITSNNLGSGTYTARLVNVADFRVLATRSFTINSVIYSEYSVSVSDTTIPYGSSGTITMSISPTQGMYSKYNFYLKVYDSKNKEVISKKYAEENVNTANTKRVVYNINANSLSSGTYTIKIIDGTNPNHVFKTAKLTIGSGSSPSSQPSKFSVSTNDVNMNYGESGKISMTVSSDYGNNCEYYFILEVLDSYSNIKIRQQYSGTVKSTNTISYSIAPYSLTPGKYTINIVDRETTGYNTAYEINAFYYTTFATAKLNINLGSSDFVVKTNDIKMIYGSNETIKMSVTAPSEYNFNLEIYNSNNKKIFNKNYMGTGSGTLKYIINPKDLKVGEYTIKITKADKKYLSAPVLTTAKLSVLNDGIIYIIANPTTFISSDTGHYYDFKILDSDNNLISNTNYEYVIDNEPTKIHMISSNGNGHIFLNGKATALGRHSIKIWCGSTFNETYYDVFDLFTMIDIDYNVAKYRENNKAEIFNLEDGMKVTVNVYTGEKYESYHLTAKDGIVKINTKNLKIGKHKVTIIADNKYHILTHNSFNIIIKAIPKLTTTHKTFKNNIKTKKYAVKLKNHLGKAMNKAKVTMKIDKKTYTAKTDKKGKATFNIKLTKRGMYKATVTYKGDTYYSRVSNKVMIKIK